MTTSAFLRNQRNAEENVGNENPSAFFERVIKLRNETLNNLR